MAGDMVERERELREMLQRDQNRYQQELARMQRASEPLPPIVGAAITVVESGVLGFLGLLLLAALSD